MGYYYTGDPYADYLAHERDQERWLEKLPRCSECGEPIQDEHCFVIYDEVICEECLMANYRKHTDDLMEC